MWERYRLYATLVEGIADPALYRLPVRAELGRTPVAMGSPWLPGPKHVGRERALTIHA
jgi:hypothetical protein